MAKFRRAHYIAVAALLGERYRREVACNSDDSTLAGIRLVANDFALAFAADNYKFKADTFKAAFHAEAGITITCRVEGCGRTVKYQGAICERCI
jgi:hypothetical protein